MKKPFAIIAILSLLFLIYCRENDKPIEDKGADEYRSSLYSKSETQQKELFSGLSTENKIRIWSSKINQIQTQKISKNQNILLEELKSEIKNSQNEKNNMIKLFEIAIELAKITPEDEFIRMFSTIEDYHRNESVYSAKVSNQNILVDLNNELSNVKKEKKEIYPMSSGKIKSSKPSCNCSWSCWGSSRSCQSSTSGCGFLWLQECHKYM